MFSSKAPRQLAYGANSRTQVQRDGLTLVVDWYSDPDRVFPADCVCGVWHKGEDISALLGDFTQAALLAEAKTVERRMLALEVAS